MRVGMVRFIVVAVTCLAASGGVWGQPTRVITPVPFNAGSPVTVSLSAGSGELRIGDMTTICFEASRAGFVTVWNIATTGAVARVYPNALQGSAASTMRVDGGRRACVGTDADPFRFRVDGPAGTEDLYLLWTARAELQPVRPGYATAGALAEDVTRVIGGAGAAEWANAKTTYDIVAASGPAAGPAPVMPAPVMPAPVTPAPGPQASVVPSRLSRKVFVLALGANVGQLVKSNQDAALFARGVMERFNVPKEGVRLVANATKADFRAGMAWLRGAAQADDLVFIYFSGHGGRVRDPTRTSDDGYDEFLVPYDFETHRPASLRDAVFSQELAGWINALPTDNVITVADACHSAGVYRSIEGDVLGARSKLYVLPDDADLTRAAPEGGTRAAGGTGRVRAKGLLLAAARRDQAALEMADGSVFTMALLAELRSARAGSLAEGFERAAERSRVRSRGRQSPTAVGPLDAARLLTFSQ